MRFLVTGSAGFIGFHLASRLLADGHSVIGIDAMSPYYDVSLKRERHRRLAQHPAFTGHEFLLEDGSAFSDLVQREAPNVIVHLAAQAGVRYSLENPHAYIGSNLVGTFNVLEACRAHPVDHLLVASTSSVYGANTVLPFRETDRTVHPLSLYAATKQSTELLAHSYAHLWNLPTTVFRFFTVYGPWGRPDMALFLFVSKILSGKPIEVFNDGKSERDFTYIDDLIEAIARLVPCVPVRLGPGESPSLKGDTLSPVAPFRVVNIGGGSPVRLSDFVDEIERVLGRKAQRRYKPLPAGDVEKTFASAELLRQLTGYVPGTPISVGVPKFVEWYRAYYGR
jgi:UDP-glucuronate 4-epimerase